MAETDHSDVTQDNCDITITDDSTMFREPPRKISSYVEQAVASQTKFSANYVTMDYVDKFNNASIGDDVTCNNEDLYDEYMTSQNANNCNNNGNQKVSENVAGL